MAVVLLAEAFGETVEALLGRLDARSAADGRLERLLALYEEPDSGRRRGYRSGRRRSTQRTVADAEEGSTDAESAANASIEHLGVELRVPSRSVLTPSWARGSRSRRPRTGS